MNMLCKIYKIIYFFPSIFAAYAGKRYLSRGDVYPQYGVIFLSCFSWSSKFSAGNRTGQHSSFCDKNTSPL